MLTRLIVIVTLMVFKTGLHSQTASISYNKVCQGQSTILTLNYNGVYDSIFWDINGDTTRYEIPFGNKINTLKITNEDKENIVVTVKIKQTNPLNWIKASTTVNYKLRPVINFSYSSSCVDMPVTLIDQSKNNTAAKNLWEKYNFQTKSFEKLDVIDNNIFYFDVLKANYYPNDTANLRLIVTNSDTCTATGAIKKIPVAIAPKAKFDKENNGCYTFTAKPDTFGYKVAYYTWDFGDGFKIEKNNWYTSKSISHYYAVPGNYTIKHSVSNIYNCINTDSTKIQILATDTFGIKVEKDKINKDVPLNDTLWAGETAKFTLLGNFKNYKWSNGSTEPSITISETGNYILTVTDGNCILTDSISIIAVLEFNPYIIKAKNTILTANADGFNDYLEFENYEGYGAITLIIYDQWGFEVYKDTNYQNNWNGKTTDGSDLKSGAYFYTIKSAAAKGQGSISILK